MVYTSLTGLARSWLMAPKVLSVSGGRSQGYNQSHRSYGFIAESSRLSFNIDASENKPINNLCFEIRNWGNSKSAQLLVEGREWNTGPDFRQGKIIDTDGTYTMIIWVALKAASPRNFGIIKN